MRRFLVPLLALACCHAFAQNDDAYGKKILEYTTEKFFLTELVDHLPSSSTVTSPQKYFGDIVGAPNILHHVNEINGYMRELEKTSPRVKVYSMGRSEGGREMIMVAISDEANLAKLDRYKEITAKLGDPRKIDDAQAESMIKEGLPMYLATGGMHSPESGPPEMLMELAYRLAVEESPFIQEIRKNSIVLITPVLETDGRDRYVDTYLYHKANPNKPEIPLVYWGNYVAHDDNRDGMSLALALSKNLMKTWFEWHPTVMHDLHESVPYLYISTGTGPYNPWLDPITVDEWHLLAYNEVDEMTRRGVPGIWTHGFFDGWAPNYGFYAANGHNAIGRFYETFGGEGADTGIQSSFGASSKQWYRPNPPFQKVRWSIRNNVNISESALLLGMHEVASEKEKFLRNYYLKSKRSVSKARTEGPTAYVFPVDEPRRGQQMILLDMLRRQGVEISVLNADAETKEGKFKKGSFVVRMDQPYSRMADMMLDKEFYNVNDPQSYDDTGWTLGPLHNVETIRVKDVKVLDAKMSPATDLPAKPAPKVEVFALVPSGDVGLTQFLFTPSHGRTSILENEASIGKQKLPVGTVIVVGGSAEWETAERLSLRPMRLDRAPTKDLRRLDAPRIALVHSWQDTQNEGWFRLAFESLKIPYSYVSLHELRDNASLKTKFDVILLPPSFESTNDLLHGIQADEPLPWKPLPGFPNLGGVDESEDVRGGMELEGVLHLRQFLKDGGLLICVGPTCRVPVDFGLVDGVSVSNAQQLNAPGGVFLAENAAKNSPIMSGYGDSLGVYYTVFNGVLRAGGRSFGGFGGGSGQRESGRGDLNDPDIVQGRAPYTPVKKDGDTQAEPPKNRPRPQVLLRFAPADKLLISGALDHGNELAGSAAAVLCPAGKGNVLLFALNPMWRMETAGSYQLLFNAAVNFDHLWPSSSEPVKKLDG